MATATQLREAFVKELRREGMKFELLRTVERRREHRGGSRENAWREVYRLRRLR